VQTLARYSRWTVTIRVKIKSGEFENLQDFFWSEELAKIKKNTTFASLNKKVSVSRKNYRKKSLVDE
jgi:hypothetical protein